MRIAQISITGLFGIFNHGIPLNLDDRITIIHAPNGYGKTIVLKMLDSLFNSKIDDFINTELMTIAYKKINIEFDNNNRLELLRDTDQGSQQNNLTLNFQQPSQSIKSFKISQTLENTPLLFQRDFLNDIRRSSKLELQERIDEKQNESWFDEVKKKISIYFIQSQRLLMFPPETTTYGRMINLIENRKSPDRLPLSTVREYSNELIEKIREYVAEYAVVSQSLDRTFPTRILERDLSNELSTEDLKVRLKTLEQHRYRLIEAGLLENDTYQNLQFQEDIDGIEKTVLSIYAEDMESKFRVFDGIAYKIYLFQRIINSRFSYKEVSISIKNGLVFKSKYPNESSSNLISSELLSSGEQHELILFYELLFKVKENSLVLIDEPEISLHVGWQISFLKDLEEISKLANLDFLIATHSPSIINGRWDLTVELKGLPQ